MDRKSDFYNITKYWLKYGVFYSILPPLLIWLAKVITGCNIQTFDLIPDSLLLSIAIAVNALGCAKEYNDNNSKKKDWCEDIPHCVLLSCFLLYGLILTPGEKDINAKGITHPIIVLGITFISILSSAVIGVIIKMSEHSKNETTPTKANNTIA